MKAKLIFDNGGGLVMQLGTKFAHYYDNMDQAARDYLDYKQAGNTNGWEGHEEELSDLDPTYYV